MNKRVMLSWSSGKDSAWALHLMRHDPEITLLGLFTTINTAFDRVAMHGVRRTLLDVQAAHVGLPLHTIRIPHPCPNNVYEASMGAFINDAKQLGTTHFSFGDLFLEDIRRYREQQLTGTGIAPLFPLWGLSTRALAQDMVASGLRAYIACVDPKQAPREWAGRIFDPAFVAAIPDAIDPCGERGEFHTFAYDGPMFRHPVNVIRGDVVERDGFVFADLSSDPADTRPRPEPAASP